MTSYIGQETIPTHCPVRGSEKGHATKFPFQSLSLLLRNVIIHIFYADRSQIPRKAMTRNKQQIRKTNFKNQKVRK